MVQKLAIMLHRRFRSFIGVALLCLPCFGGQNPPSGTAPFILDNNRIYVEMTLVRPDGSLRKTLAFVDLGSPAMILSEALFKEFEINKGRR